MRERLLAYLLVACLPSASPANVDGQALPDLPTYMYHGQAVSGGVGAFAVEVQPPVHSIGLKQSDRDRCAHRG